MIFKLTRREPCMCCGTHSQAAKIERNRIIARIRECADGDPKVSARLTLHILADQLEHEQ